MAKGIIENEYGLEFLAIYRLRVEDAQSGKIDGDVIKVNEQLKELFEISFNKNDGKLGKVQPFHFLMTNDRVNTVREGLIKILANRKTKIGAKKCDELAIKLQSYLDDRTKDLLFIIGIGNSNKSSKQRCVLWVFPSDKPIQFKKSKSGPTIKEIQDAFSRSSRLRKAVYFDSPLTIGRNDLLKGDVIDNTAGVGKSWSTYWVEKFLEGQIELLPKRGTMLLLKALDSAQASAKSQKEISSVLASYHKLLSGSMKSTTLEKFSNELVGEAKKIYLEKIPKTIERDAVFEIDETAVSKRIRSYIIELVNGLRVFFPPNLNLDPESYISEANGRRTFSISSEVKNISYGK